MQFAKKSLALFISLIMTLVMLTACGKTETNEVSETDQTEQKTDNTADAKESGEEEGLTGTLTFWHFNSDEGPALAREFENAHPGVTVKDQITADTDGSYQTKIQAASRSGNLPDVYAAENAFVKRFVEMPGGYQPLKFPDVKDVTSKLVPYTVQIGTNLKGELMALSHQSCAGGIGYKREMAKKYLGTDNPKEVGKMLTEKNILDTARKVKKASGGKAKLFVGTEELYKIYVGSRDHAWIENGKFVIDPKMYDFIDLAKTMRDEELEGGLPQWKEAWANSIQDDVHMCYAVPTWGVSWIIDCRESDDVMIMTNDDHPTAGSGGRWGITTPIPYYEGGTWFGISQNAKNKELAWEFIKFITSNQEFLEGVAEAGDVVSNKDIIEKYEADDSFINKVVNQNIYQVYGPMLEGINGSLVTKYDDTIKIAFLDGMDSYLAEQISKEEMLAQFIERLESELQGENISFE